MGKTCDDMNLLFTTVGNLCDSQQRVDAWRSRHQIVEVMPMERIANYLRYDAGSALALVDAIICAADTIGVISWHSGIESINFNFPLEKALWLAENVRDLPESCAMRDGRKWRSIPFIIFPNPAQSEAIQEAEKWTHANILPFMANRHPIVALKLIQEVVNKYQNRILQDYVSFGILVRIVNGNIQVSPALRKKNPEVESEYYHLPADRRSDRGWITVRRDNHGLQHDIEVFEQLIDKNVNESQLHAFFEQHPTFLMQACMGIPISHSPNFVNPKDHKPDFALLPIFGPQENGLVELLELKRSGEKILTRGLHRGFSAKVHSAINQVRDYGRDLRDPANIQSILRAFGYIPHKSKLAVLIGRAPRDEADKEMLLQRQREIDVKIVTYDEILETQANQLGSVFIN